jgi:phage gp45-like
MMTPVLAINMQVQCCDGTVHDGVKMYVRDGQKVFIDCDDCEIADVETIQQATAVVPPAMLLAAMQQCKEVQ